MNRIANTFQLAATILLFSCIAFGGVVNAQSDAKKGSTAKGSATKGSTSKGSDSKGSGSKAVEMKEFQVADGALTFSAPANWKKSQPKFDFIHADFTIPKAEGDERDGRLTISQVGGSLDANLNRWVDQFVNVDADNEDQMKKEKAMLNDMPVHMIKIAGTFKDGAGPFAPKTERKDYVLVGAAIEMEGGANVYIKSYGPKKTMAANAATIKKMIKKMKVNK